LLTDTDRLQMIANADLIKLDSLYREHRRAR
jgi:hypothetical protein